MRNNDLVLVGSKPVNLCCYDLQGGLCRGHHILKQHPGWHLTQPAPGHFQWTTPAGRTYTTTPDTQPS